MRARIVHGAVLAALTATGVAWVSSDKSVTVEIDGQSRIIVTHASTVADVLDVAGIAVDAHDTLAPSAGARVSDHSVIVIRRGRLVNVRVNDVERGVWVNSLDVDQVLREIGIDADDRTYVSASRSPSTGEFLLQVRMPSEVELRVEGVSRTVVTTAATVADLLTQENVTLSVNDAVNVPLGSYPAEGTTIVVADSRGPRIARTRPIAFKTVTKRDPRASAGSTRVDVPGVAGVLVLYFRQPPQGVGPAVAVADGSRVARKPVDRVVLVGTRKVVPASAKPAVIKPKVIAPPRKPVIKPATKPPVKKPAARPPVRKTAPKPVPVQTGPSHKPAADKLNWAALAACESGNNPRALSPGGLYHGLYQFLLSTWHSVGGVGDPINATRDEQTYRAQILYSRVGARAWGSCGHRLFG